MWHYEGALTREEREVHTEWVPRWNECFDEHNALFEESVLKEVAARDAAKEGEDGQDRQLVSWRGESPVIEVTWHRSHLSSKSPDADLICPF